MSRFAIRAFHNKPTHAVWCTLSDCYCYRPECRAHGCADASSVKQVDALFDAAEDFEPRASEDL